MRAMWDSSGVRFIREMVTVYFDRRVSRSAAELAYFLILSFFPVLICINAFVGLLRLDVNLVLEAADGFLPQEILPILGEYIRYISINQSNAMFFAGLTMVLFSASAAFRALMNIMADIYERPTYRGIGQIVASVLFSLLFLVTIYLSMVVLLTGNWFLHLVEGRFVWIARLVGDWQSMRFFILFCLVLLFVLLAYRLAAVERGQDREDYVEPRSFLRELSWRMEEDSVLAADPGQGQIWAARHHTLRRGRFLTSGGLGTMGYALPAALGAKLAQPGRQVVAVCGDGAFQMSLCELATVHAANAPLKIVVLDNRRLGMVREYQNQRYDSRHMATHMYGNPDFVALCQAYGIPAARAENNAQASRLIGEMLSAPTPYVLVCRVDPDTPSI